MNKFSGILKRGFRYIFRGVPIIDIKAEILLSAPSEKLKGKSIIITGGGKGLGKSMAQKFVLEGANVLITGRDEEALAKTSTEIGCQYEVLDVQRPELFDKFILLAESKLGGLDILVNNAGISLHENHFFDVNPGGFDKQIATNFKGAYFLTQRFIKRLPPISKPPPLKSKFKTSFL